MHASWFYVLWEYILCYYKINSVDQIFGCVGVGGSIEGESEQTVIYQNTATLLVLFPPLLSSWAHSR